MTETPAQSPRVSRNPDALSTQSAVENAETERVEQMSPAPRARRTAGNAHSRAETGCAIQRKTARRVPQTVVHARISAAMARVRRTRRAAIVSRTAVAARRPTVVRPHHPRDVGGARAKNACVRPTQNVVKVLGRSSAPRPALPAGSTAKNPPVAMACAQETKPVRHARRIAEYAPPFVAMVDATRMNRA